MERLIGRRLEDLDSSDPRVLHGLAQLRSELVEAKEALSTETHVEVPLFLPGTPPVAWVTRAEFEQAIRPLSTTPWWPPTSVALRRCGGGRCRAGDRAVGGWVVVIPLVSAMVSEVLELPTAVDEHLKHAVALERLGCGLTAGDRLRWALGPGPTAPMVVMAARPMVAGSWSPARGAVAYERRLRGSGCGRSARRDGCGVPGPLG
ncbi:MAG: hypothetical protein R2749_03540 [Acidimicrobiales bacterium]